MLDTEFTIRWLEGNLLQPLIRRIMLVTVHGDLLAYTSPTDIKNNRDVAALITNRWKELDRQLQHSTNRSRPSWESFARDIATGEIYAMTVESVTGNILVRAVQPKVLMILDGIRPALPKKNIEINVEVKGQKRYPSVAPLPDMIDVSDADLGSEAGYAKVLNAMINGSDLPEEEDSTEREVAIEATNDKREGEELPPPGREMRVQDVHAAPRTAMNDEIASVVLSLQRTKLDNMADWYAEQLSKEDFVLGA